MERDNPFSFEGRIGRKRLWLTFIVINVVGMISAQAFPTAEHKIGLSDGGGHEFDLITYGGPIEPATNQSWLMFGASTLISIIMLWVLSAATVKRLHDLGKSGWWVGFVVGGLIFTVMTVLLLRPVGVPGQLTVIAFMILLAPFSLTGALGMFMVCFLKGYPVPIPLPVPRD